MKSIIILTLSVFFTMPVFSQEDTDGKELFRNNCRACHSIDKDLVGPALKDVTQRRDSVWLYSFITNSQRMISEGDSTAVALFAQFNQIPMPNQNLSTTEIASILSHIEIESRPDVSSAADQPIQRPQPTIQSYAKPLQFSDFVFWVPITVGIIAVVSILYGIIVLTEAVKKKEMGVKL